MKATLLILFVTFVNLFGQNLEEKYKELAVYSIVMKSFEFWQNEDDWSFYPITKKTIEKAYTRLQNEEYDYEINQLFKIVNIDIIEIVDKTNIGSHPYHRYLYAIRSIDNDPNYFQIRLQPESILKFINNFIYGEYDEIDKKEIINLYNTIYYYFDDAIFYNGKNEPEFKILSSDYRFYDFLKFKKGYDDYYLSNALKIYLENMITYHYTTYKFDCKEFHVETYLLYMVKK